MASLSSLGRAEFSLPLINWLLGLIEIAAPGLCTNDIFICEDLKGLASDFGL